MNLCNYLRHVFLQDDFLGSMTMDLTKFPRGARSAKLCTLDMLKTDGTVPTMNLFKQKRTKGWWPFYAKNEGDELMLQVEYRNIYLSKLFPYLLSIQGKVEAELILMTAEEADKNPAGAGREDPNGLDKPT